MTTNWLELMGDDSNLSMTSIEDDLSRSRQEDPELDHSRQGVNLLFKQSIKIISEDSQSRKRTLNEMKSTDNDGSLGAMSKLPPKAKQRTDDLGHWAHRKNGGSGPIGFGRFLKWAPKAGPTTTGNRTILGSRTNDNRRNIMRAATSASAAPLNALVTCTPGKPRGRKLSRGRRSRKASPRKSSPRKAPTPKKPSPRKHDLDDHKEEATASEKAEVEHEEDEDEDVDMDMDDRKTAEPGPDGTGLENAAPAATDLQLCPHASSDGDADDEEEEDEEQEEVKIADEKNGVEQDEDEDQKEQEEEEDEDEDEDDDLSINDQCASVGRRSRRVTPTLSNVVFNADLMRHKVPILRKAEEPDKAKQGPVFLNGDQYDRLHPKEDRRGSPPGQTEHGAQGEQKARAPAQPQPEPAQAEPAKHAAATPNTRKLYKQAASKQEAQKARKQTPMQRKPAQPKQSQRQGPLAWATKLFGGSAGTARSERQMSLEESNARRIMLSRESSVRSLDLKSVESVRSEQTADSAESQQSKGSHAGMGFGLGRISRVGSPKSVGSRSSSVSTVCAPSEGATKWRQKQIQYGFNTEGYKNFIAQYPNKDAMFRLNHEFVPTPDPKEKIGKKRWVGKYQKWRKFLHKFDPVPTPAKQTKPVKQPAAETQAQTEPQS